MVPCGLGPRRQRDVDALEREARIERFIAERGLSRGDGLAHPVAQAVEQRAFLAALVGAHAAQRLQQFADRALFAQRRHAHGFERGFVGRAARCVENLALEAIEYRSWNDPQSIVHSIASIAIALAGSWDRPRFGWDDVEAYALRRWPDPPEP